MHRRTIRSVEKLQAVIGKVSEKLGKYCSNTSTHLTFLAILFVHCRCCADLSAEKVRIHILGIAATLAFQLVPIDFAETRCGATDTVRTCQPLPHMNSQKNRKYVQQRPRYKTSQTLLYGRQEHRSRCRSKTRVLVMM